MALYGTCRQEAERRLFSVPKKTKRLVSDGLEEAFLGICRYTLVALPSKFYQRSTLKKLNCQNRECFTLDWLREDPRRHLFG
jgi:hypothetical protein